MDFYKILQGIMDERGLSVAAVARMCKLADGTVRSIIARKQKNVALEVAFKLSDGLGVSLEQLNGMPDELLRVEPAPTLAPDETALLSIYRELNADGKHALMQQAELYSQVDSFRKDTSSATA